MNSFLLKIKLIYVPLLIITFCTILIYTFLNWLFIVKLNLFQPDEAVVNFMVPLFLPWIPLLIWINPRLKMLVLTANGRRNPFMGILLINWATISTPMIIAQSLMLSATGKLTQLDFMSQIIHFPKTKFYTVRKFYIGKRFAHTKAVFSVSGKYNSDFVMALYTATPVFDHLFPDTNLIVAIRKSVNQKALIILNDTLSTMIYLKKLPVDSIRYMKYLNPTFVMPKYGNAGKYGAIVVITKGSKLKNKLPPFKIAPVAWLAFKYTQTISNHLSPSEKQQRFKQFAYSSFVNFNHWQINKFTYLDRVPYGKDLENYIAAVRLHGDVIENEGDPAVFYPNFGSFEKRNIDMEGWIFVSFAIGSGIFWIILAFVKLKNVKVD